jgi:hypothetical protein
MRAAVGKRGDRAAGARNNTIGSLQMVRASGLSLSSAEVAAVYH